MMGKFVDITGQKFGRLTVIKRVENSTDNRPQWLCKCECGRETKARGYGLKRGKILSCGCYHIEKAREIGKSKSIHGLSETRLYRIWHDMKNRCYSKKHKSYNNYGGRNIIVCEEWLNDFKAFYDWSMQNGYSDNLSIDRKDTNGNYTPNNCRWADKETQQNNKRNNHYITYNGKTQTVSQWAKETGIKTKTLLARINDYHWSIEKALTKEVKR